MNTRFKVLASYNILQNLCGFIHVLIFVTISQCRKKSQINEYSDHYKLIYFIVVVQKASSNEPREGWNNDS